MLTATEVKHAVEFLLQQYREDGAQQWMRERTEGRLDGLSWGYILAGKHNTPAGLIADQAYSDVVAMNNLLECGMIRPTA